jgi:dihydroflavonol-4-reductase
MPSAVLPDPAAPVVLTGASGFIAKHIARELLERGYAVRATLRTPARAEEVRAAVLPGLPQDAADRLTFVQADLGSDIGWPEAMAGPRRSCTRPRPFRWCSPRDPLEVIRPPWTAPAAPFGPPQMRA